MKHEPQERNTFAEPGKYAICSDQTQGHKIVDASQFLSWLLPERAEFIDENVRNENKSFKRGNRAHIGPRRSRKAERR